MIVSIGFGHPDFGRDPDDQWEPARNNLEIALRRHRCEVFMIKDPSQS
jgi:hypothetical protein